MTEAADARIAEGLKALEDGDWERARAAFAPGAQAGDPHALDGLGQVLWFSGDIEGGVRAREAAYVGFRRAGDDARAGVVALWLAVEHASAFGDAAVANGWFRRGERLLDGLGRRPERVELEIQRSRRAGDPAAAEAHLQAALALAREIGSPDEEVRAMSQLGMHLVAHGRATEGFALLDESMAAAMGGELRSPWQIGGAACSMLGVCDQMDDMERATQWCRVVLRSLERRGWVPLFAWCRTAFAGVLIATGHWEQAEQEALSALRAYGGPDAPMAPYALARLAELRLRQGRVEEARRLVDGLESHGRVAPVAAAIALASGDAAAARRAVERRLGGGPAAHGPASAGWLALLAEAQLAEGDVEGARATAARLEALAASDERRNVRAGARLVAGRAALAVADARAAGHLEAALADFTRLGMPLDAARARLGLAQALATEDPVRAAAEARHALRTAEALGARPDADRAAALLRDLTGGGRSAPRLSGELTAREREVLTLLAEGCSNAAIAERLVISPKTAEHHVSRVLRKLGLTSRAEAAAHAVRAGLLPGG